jgi:hypothetical protein
VVALLGGGGARAPDLVESAVSVSQHGRTLTIVDSVRNSGDAVAPRSRTAFFLGRRRIGSRAVGRLLPLEVSRHTTTLALPSSIRAGSWRLRACADALGQVHERNEQNNCRVATRLVRVGDVTPPKFAGLARATTCIPGPVGGPVRNTPFALSWNPATDDVTPQSEIVYEIYEAHAPGTEDFAHPSYVSDPGATTFVTPPLPDDVSHYFVVRARDAAGNRDRNKVERLGENLCL